MRAIPYTSVQHLQRAEQKAGPMYLALVRAKQLIAFYGRPTNPIAAAFSQISNILLLVISLFSTISPAVGNYKLYNWLDLSFSFLPLKTKGLTYVAELNSNDPRKSHLLPFLRMPKKSLLSSHEYLKKLKAKDDRNTRVALPRALG